ncbi:MAG TPA: diguanylate cyclase [Polyangiaceae bacterium]|nr:diguanylate cyclase [Polyangiaceae bacterium]
MLGDDPKHKRLLLVDDDSVTRSVLSRQLSVRGYEIIEAESGGSALRVLTQPDAPRMAVVDWNMGTINGPELCRILRGRSPYVYVVLTTAREGRRPLVEAMNSGADGYIQKPVDVDELEAWLVAGQRIVELQDGLLKAHAELERRATHDALTGVRNRGSLMEILGRELRRSIRTKSATGIVLLDVDHFKAINDTHGHPVGDEVLVEFASRCARAVRDYDVVGRYGGEEFLLILPGGTLPDAAAVGGRLLDAIARRPFTTSAGEIKVTASAGAASTGQGYLDVDAMITAADTALYEAKRAGRARLHVAAEAGQPESARFGGSEPDTMKGPD